MSFFSKREEDSGTIWKSKKIKVERCLGWISQKQEALGIAVDGIDILFAFGIC